MWKGVHQTDESGYSQGTGGVAGGIFMHYLEDSYFFFVNKENVFTYCVFS